MYNNDEHNDDNTFILYDEIDVPLLDFGGVGEWLKSNTNVSGVTATAVSEESKSETAYMQSLGFNMHDVFPGFRYE